MEMSIKNNSENILQIAFRQEGKQEIHLLLVELRLIVMSLLPKLINCLTMHQKSGRRFRASMTLLLQRKSLILSKCYQTMMDLRQRIPQSPVNTSGRMPLSSIIAF